MIHTTAKTGSDGKTKMWFFIIGYAHNSYAHPPLNSNLNRKGAVTYFYKMIQREKRLYAQREKDYACIREAHANII